MVDLAEFQKRLKNYCRTIEYKQHQLARDIGLSPTAFSNKLNGTRGAPLSRLEIKNIITRLVEAQAINTRPEVVELLSLMDLKEVTFSPAEWQSPPFNQLETTHAAPFHANGSTPTRPAKTPVSSHNGLHPSTPERSKPRQLLTFLFTSFGDSSRLWQAYPSLMPGVLLKHNRLVQESIEDGGGKVFKTTAKEFFASFSDPREAVLAAADLQKRLQAEEWPGQTGAIKVSIALHTGIPEMEQAGDFFGQPVNRTAELLALGQPGQILLTGVTASLVLDQLPADLRVRDLGQHQLKDLARSESIFQLEGKELPDSFATLATAENSPGNLPFQLTSFVGRESEQKDLRQLLTTRRLVVLMGIGGVGKTRLALEAAGQMRNQFKDGVWLVELAPLTDPAFIVPALAQTFGLKEEPGVPLSETLLKFLKKKQVLVVLDNCEHLVQDCATLADLLLRNCPGLTILATSQAALEITAETVRQIQPLEAPAAFESPRQLSAYASVKLFTDRAEAVQAGFHLTGGNGRLVRDICAQLDGIPLALELAAARLHTATVGEIAASLDQRFQTLARGSRANQPRHQTLRALVDWSYNVLSPWEQTLLRRLSVFSGSWQFPAMAAICNQEDFSRETLKDVLLQLVSKSLVVAEKDSEGAGTSYRLLETIRFYSRDELEQSGEAASTLSLYRLYYLRLAEESEPGLRSPEASHWLTRLEREQGNFRNIFGQILASAENGQPFGGPFALETDTDKDALQLALRMGGALGDFWLNQGYWSEGRRWLEALLAFPAGNRVTPLIEAKARLVAGSLAWTQGDFPRAKSTLTRSLELYQEADDKPGVSETLLVLGKLASKQGNFDEALRLLNESMQLKQDLGDIQGLADVLNRQGDTAYAHFDYESAKNYYRQSLAYYRKLDQSEGEASVLNNLAAVAVRQRDLTSGELLARESLQIFRRLENRPGIIKALNSVGILAFRQGRIAEAVKIHNECLEMRLEIGDKPGIAASHQNLGNIAYSEKDFKSARQNFEAAIRIYREMGERNYLPRVINNLANIDLLEGNYTRAQQSYEECMVIYLEIDDKENYVNTSSNLGLLAYLTGDYTKAERDYIACLMAGLELNFRNILINVLIGMAGVFYRQAQPLESAATPLEVTKYNSYLYQVCHLIGAIQALYPAIALELGHAEQVIFNEAVAWVQARLSEETFNRQVAEGQSDPESVIKMLTMLKHY